MNEAPHINNVYHVFYVQTSGLSRPAVSAALRNAKLALQLLQRDPLVSG